MALAVHWLCKFREPLPAHSSLAWIAGEESSGRDAQPRLFLSSTTPETLRWASAPSQGADAMSPTQPTRLPLYSGSPGHAEQTSQHRTADQILQAELLVQNLLGDLQPEDLVWTQAQAKLQQRPPSQEVSTPFTKQSACELELDAHVSQVRHN